MIYVNAKNYSLKNNFSLTAFPNPSTGKTTISVELPSNNQNSKALIKIYDLTGELVNIIPVDNVRDSFASVTWNGKGKYNDLSSGLYTCSLEINGNTVASQKLIIKK